MKKTFILIFALLIGTIQIHAQQNKSYIEVLGASTYQKKIKLYKASVVITLENANNTNSTLEKVKEDYFRKLNKIGISPKQLKEDRFAYGAIGYQTQGTIYKFETPSKELFEKFLLIKNSGVYTDLKSIDFSLDQEVAEIQKKAIENARQKAENLAKKIHKKLGKILSIKDSNNLNINNDNRQLGYYNFSDKSYYTLTVSFEIMDK